MLNNLKLFRFLAILLVRALAACGGTGQPDNNPTKPVAVSSLEPAEPATVTPLLPSLTPTRITATASAVPQPPGPTTTAPRPPDDIDTPTAVETPAVTETPVATATAEDTAQPRDLSGVRVELQPAVGGLDRPLGIANAADGSNRLFILEKAGRIRLVLGGQLQPESFLDIRDRVGSSANEQGLLGLAFHPRFPENGLLFVNYTDRDGDTVVSRFSISGVDQVDPASEAVLLRLDQPAGNHNGGHLVFGPDGYLYIGMGDGGAAGDRFGNGQNGQTLLGAMLRLDVDAAQPYGVPPDNPFVGNSAVLDEIWAVGLRNPWRYSFDRETGDLYIGDVGQSAYEEINFQVSGSPGGENYGWPIMEGLHCYPADQPCDRIGLVSPIGEYDHGQGCSVTGGYVYRGRAFPLLSGVYVFGDYCSGRIWGMIRDEDGQWQTAPLAQADVALSSFGEDEAGELYVVDMAAGALLRLTAR